MQIDPERWPAFSRLMDQMLDLPPGERADWVRGLTGPEAEMAPQLITLLQTGSDAARTDWMDTLPKLGEGALLTLMESGAGYEDVGDEVGPYRLVRLIARGGMGSVWYAERSDRLVRRGVALKLPLGSSRQLAARFAREREIVAGLVHPNIARLYDAGVSDSGQAYLALEYVEGQTLDQYCDRNRLNARARIALFGQVLSAVQYAHSRLVIHRDIKPSNILVNNEGEVRLLDFGVAKLLDPETTEPSELTQLADPGMTLAYASPEQVAGQPVTTATDVYSLGVVLFELLAGVRPYRTRRDTRGALEEAILQADIPLASAMAGGTEEPQEVAEARATTLPRLRRELQGDIDSILIKALSRKPQERYETAASFADDLERYRDGRAVRAHQRSRWYQMQKFVGRNRVGVGVALATVVVLTTATGVALAQKKEAERQAQLAASERDRALAAVAHREAVDEFMSDLLLEAGRTGKPVSIMNLISRAETLSATEFANNPDARAAVLKTVAEFELEFDGPEKALAKFEMANQMLASSRDSGLRSSVACSEAVLRAVTGQAAQGRKVLLASIVDGGTPDSSRSECYADLAQLAIFQYDKVTAIQSAEKALELWESTSRRSPLHRLEFLTIKADAQILNGKPAEAEEGYAQVMNDLHRVGRDRGAVASSIRIRRIDAASSSGDLHGALALIDEAIAINREDLPDRAPPVLLLYERGLVLSDLGLYGDALSGFESILRHYAKEDRRVTYSSFLASAVALSRIGKRNEAEKYYERAVALAKNSGGGFGPADELKRMLARARLDIDRREFVGAREVLSQALQVEGALDVAVMSIHYLRSQASLGSGDVDNAKADAQVALQMSETLRGAKPYSAWVGLASFAVAQVASARTDMANARASFAMSIEQLQHSVNDGHPVLMQARERFRELQ
jgi:tetratricopeptide (TPR) repeat protein